MAQLPPNIVDIPRQAGQGQSKRKRWPLILIALIIIIVLVGWQFLSVHTNNTDPTVAGRPLSNPQIHLHTVATGGKPGVLYLGTHYGLFTSTDGGRTWPQTRGILNDLMITVIAVSPEDASNLAVVGNPSTSAGKPAGLYFSQDNGATWNLRTPANLPGSAYPFTVRAGYANPGHFYAFYLYAGWFETRDMGLHWQALTHNTLADMQNPTLLPLADSPDHLLLGGDKGLYESRDNGAHWTKITAVQGTVQSLISSQNAPATIFCATDQGLYRWQDSGTTQVQQITFPGTTPPTRIASDAAGMILYGLAGKDLWYSADSGKSWTKQAQFDRGDNVALIVDSQHAQRLYIGFFLPAKVLTSNDGGRSWQILTA